GRKWMKCVSRPLRSRNGNTDSSTWRTSPPAVRSWVSPCQEAPEHSRRRITWSREALANARKSRSSAPSTRGVSICSSSSSRGLAYSTVPSGSVTATPMGICSITSDRSCLRQVTDRRFFDENEDENEAENDGASADKNAGDT